MPAPESHSSSSPRLAGKTALVTGAASGIGKATAHRLAEEGAKVALADVNEGGLREVADAIVARGGTALVQRTNVASESDWQNLMTAILNAWTRLDICVNGAGIAAAKPIVDLELGEWRRVMSINLDGVFLGTRHALRAMTASGGGCIVNLASAAGIRPVAGNVAYGTSKAAIRFLTRVAALEGKPHGIRVNSISPGAVATPMWESTAMWPRQVAETEGQEAALRALVSEHGFAKPEEIAAAVAFLAGDDAIHITGADLPVDDGFSVS